MVDTVKILGALLGGGNMSSGSGANILKSVLGAAMSGGQGGGLSSLLGSVLGGSQQQQSGGGGLGGMLSKVLGGGGAQQQSGGGLSSMLGSVLGGGGQQQAQSAGGLGDMLGGVLGGNQAGSGGGAGLQDLIGSALNQFGHSEQAAQRGEAAPNFASHSPNHNESQMADQATIMVRAMINAAKADGRVDKAEQEAILGKLGSVTQDEINFVNSEMEQPLDVQSFAQSVPQGLENQVYAMSLMAIDLDSQEEAKYLDALGQGLNINHETANQIHSQLGAPQLYS